MAVIRRARTASFRTFARVCFDRFSYDLATGQTHGRHTVTDHFPFNLYRLSLPNLVSLKNIRVEVGKDYAESTWTGRQINDQA